MVRYEEQIDRYVKTRQFFFYPINVSTHEHCDPIHISREACENPAKPNELINKISNWLHVIKIAIKKQTSKANDGPRERKKKKPTPHPNETKNYLRFCFVVLAIARIVFRGASLDIGALFLTVFGERVTM